MSMDKLIADLMATVAANTAATEKNTALLERVVAGQEAAMAKLEGGAGTTRTRRSTTKATEPAASAETPPVEEGNAVDDVSETHPLLATPNSETTIVKNPKTGADEPTPTANFRASDFSRDQVKNEFIGWLGETDNVDERKERAGFVAAIGQHFGVKQPFHPSEGLADDDQRKQTLFYLRRKRAGLKVDFATDYDFDGDPLADQTAGEPAADDFDALG